MTFPVSAGRSHQLSYSPICIGVRETRSGQAAAMPPYRGGPARTRTACLFGANEALCPRELQAQGRPVAEAVVQLSDGEGVNDPQAAARALSAVPLMTTHLPGTAKQKGPSRAPADRVERIQSWSGTGRLRTTAECARPASHRCVLGVLGRWRRGSFCYTPTRPASLHYSVVVKVRSAAATLGGGRGERSLQSLAGPDPSDRCLEPLGYPTWCAVVLCGRIAHGILRVRGCCFGLRQLDAIRTAEQLFATKLGHEIPRATAETPVHASPLGRAMQFGNR